MSDGVRPVMEGWGRSVSPLGAPGNSGSRRPHPAAIAPRSWDPCCFSVRVLQQHDLLQHLAGQLRRLPSAPQQR